MRPCNASLRRGSVGLATISQRGVLCALSIFRTGPRLAANGTLVDQRPAMEEGTLSNSGTRRHAMNSSPANKRSASNVTQRPIHARRYRKPPVIEALYEIYFSGSSWDDTVPGTFYERVKEDYPKKQQKRIQETEIKMELEHAMAGVRLLFPWMQFVSDEKHRMIQVARDLVVVNQLAPYPHFEEWETEIYRAFRIYTELAEPKTISRLGMRYINRVVIPQGTVRMEDYFTIYPNLPKRCGDSHGSFLVRVEVPEEDSGHRVVITFGNAPPPPAERPAQAFVLDLYDIVLVDEPPDEERLRARVHQAHDNLVMAFEDSITDCLRALFEPED